MGYAHALRTAGATIIEFKETGSYQGTWGAIVDFNGQRSLVTGYYGSCSYCDAYQSQFDRYSSDEPVFDEETGKYYSNRWQEQEITKEAYDADQEEQKQALIDFGMSYLRNPNTKEDILNKIKYYDELGDDEWSFDSEERELYDWAITFFN
jgi:hypothetical protein